MQAYDLFVPKMNSTALLYMKTRFLCTIHVIAGLLLFAATQNLRALDNGVDPYNLRKGDWVYVLSTATNHLGGNVSSVTSVATLMSYEASQGMNWIVIKSGEGSTNFPNGTQQLTSSVITAAHNAGLKIFGYTRSYGVNVGGEIKIATNTMVLGADGYIIDAEIEWESANLANNTTVASNLLGGIKAVFPNRFLGHSPSMYISVHSSFPYKQFGLYCDATMPQAYWKEFGISSSAVVSDMDSEWSNWQDGLSGAWTNAIKPIAPIGEGWNGVTGSEITTFYNTLKADANPATAIGYQGISWWRADLHTAAMWTSIGANSIGVSSANNPVITQVASSPNTTIAEITWTTDQSSDSVVEYGLTTSYGTLKTNTTLKVYHSLTLSNLTIGTTYHYRVKSKNQNAKTGVSGDFSFTTTTTVPDIIIDNGQATIVGTWTVGTSSTDKFGSDYRYNTAGTGAEYLKYIPNIAVAGNYEVYEWHPQGSNRTSAAKETVTYNGGSQLFNVDQTGGGGQWNLLGTFNFTAGTAGSLKIADNHPDSAQLVMADAVKFVYVPPVTPPSAPSGLAASVISASQINLAWTDNSTTENNFIVGRSTVNGGPYTDIATVGANVVSYNNTGLSENTTYYYVVRARNAGGDSANSNQASGTTPQTIPAAPSGLSATAVSSSQINLAWTDNSGNESGFIVGRSTVSGGPYTDITTTAANATSFNNTGLSSSTTYYYVVRSYNTAGSSANSAQASATTFAPIPAAPSGLTATAVSSSEIDLTWTDNSSNEDSFVVGRSTTSGGPYTDITTTAANATGFNNTGLAASTTYYYVVRARNVAGDSANAAEAGATTQSGSIPGEIIVDNPSATVVGTWTTASLAPDRYGADYYYNGAGTGAEYVQFSPTIPALGNYDVYEWHSAGANRTTDGTLIVNFKGGSQSFFLNQTAGGGQWNFVGTFSFAAGSAGNVKITDAFSTGSVVIADAIRFVPNTNAVADIIIDNPAATVTGTWSTGTSSTDKFGTDYRFKSQGTGAAFLTYTPTMLVAANYQVYEWHPQGTNRTTNAPVVINYNGGSVTNFINQKVNGGTWVAVGAKRSFVAGSTGFVQVTDAFPDAGQSVMADAIKFVFNP